MRDAIGQQECALQADKQCLQYTKVADCDNRHTTHSAAHKQRQQFDNNLATTHQLDVQYNMHCSIAAFADNLRVQSNMHKITWAHQHQVINPTCPITSVTSRGSQLELQHV